MVDDLLDVGRIKTGKVELRRRRVLLAEIVRDAVEACRPQIEEAGHELSIELPDEPICLDADAARLVQVLMNLLNNAVKFTENAGRIQLSAETIDGQVAIRIRDTGCGIPSQALPHVFDMFAQVNDVRSSAQNGLGLGLHIVRTLVELHGGGVEVRSEGAGRGAEFTVRLPVVAPDISLEAASPNGPVSEIRPNPLRRVLVVDDNRDAAQMLSMMLNKNGFECHKAYDGPTALDLADKLHPHAIVLDLGMPEMSGLEVARRLRMNSIPRETLLIALTGWDKEEDRRLSREAGFDHHLAKPVAFERLRELLHASRADGAFS
jgi:CheY-like chemotaxis protein